MSISKLLPRKLKNSWRLPGLDEQGQSIIIIAFAVLGLIAMLGLALDVGLVYIERTRIKRAVDAAVLAGVVELPSEEQAYLRAIGYLDENGYRLRDGNANPQINVYMRGCAHDGYLRTENYGDYHDTGDPSSGARPSVVRDGKTYYLYFPPPPVSAPVPDPTAEFFIDTRTFQSRDSAGDPLGDGEQCDGNTLLGTANKIHLDGIIPVRMNFMQFFGFKEVPVWDEAVAENVTNLDVAVVFDISGSMQFDTTCYGCYEPYRDGTKDWEDMSKIGNLDYDPDFSINYPNPVYVNPIPVDHLPTTYLDGSSMSLSYGFAAGNPALPDPPTPQNAESLCADRDSNTVDYKTTVGAGNPKHFIIIEAELYSLNTSLLAGPFRQPGRGFWAIQHTDWRTVLRMENENWDPDNSHLTGATPILPTASYGNYERSSWVSHHPYASWALSPPLSIPFGHDYTLAEVQATPNDVPSLEYDFFISGNPSKPWQDDGDTRIWARVQDGGSFGYDESFNHNSNIYWALYDYSELQNQGLGNDNPADDAQPVNGNIQVSANTPGTQGSNYGGADDNRWRWIRLTSAGLDLPDTGTKKYTLKIWAGGAGYDIDQIVIGNTNDTSFTTNYSSATPAQYSTSSYATPGSAFRQACNHCNPIYGLLISDKNECTPNKDNGSSLVDSDGTDNGDPLQERLFGGYQPLRDAKEATKRFIARLNPQFDQVGVASYSYLAPAAGRMELRCRRYYNADQCFQGSSPISYTEVLDVLERVPPNGSTNMAEGMMRGLEMLGINSNNVAAATWTEASNCNSATDHCSRGGSARRVMIVLTDGVANKNPWDGPWSGARAANENCYATDLYQPNVGDNSKGRDSEDRAKDCAYFYAKKAADSNVTIYTIGLGNGVDTNYLETIAKLPGSDGEFFQAVSSSQLDDIFDTILGSISVRLIQ